MATPSTPAPSRNAERLAALRRLLAEEKLTGFIVPHADENQSEYLPPSAERLAWLTGFTGSAGMAIVLADRAAVFVDGRYTLQAANEVDASAFLSEHLIENPPAKWLAANAAKGDRIGYDPWLMTVAEVRRFAEAAKSAGAELVAMTANPIDRLWQDRPEPPMGQVSLHPVEFAGEEAADKIARLQAALAGKANAVVLTQADSIAWLLNIRGSDIGHNPVALAFALLPADGKPQVFIDGRKLSNSVRDAIAAIADPRAPDELLPALADFAAGKTIQLDPQTTADALAGAIREAGGTVIEAADPVVLPRARKNATEIEGARRAQIRDGAAMVRFLAWLDANVLSGGIDEMAAAEMLGEFRADTAKRDHAELIDLSFDTISGAGPNGAIIHYRVSPATTRLIAADTPYLVDSGGQYRDGTTDVTRTVAIGTPTEEMRDRFTRVLRGNIALATARFPVGTSGAQLDAFARAALWQAGLDYDHGTGHGVGSFLSVHEGPARISKQGTVALEPGMILSNEPGYYKPGAWGIRIETLLLVKPAEAIAGGDRPMLSFETLTEVPIDRRLIEPALLTAADVAWLNAYHAALPAKLGHLLDDAEKAWLATATAPIS